MACDMRPNAIICSRGPRATQCWVCGRGLKLGKGWKLCDFPLSSAGTGKTCDRPLCTLCAVHVEPDLDYCPAHARMKGLDEQKTGSLVSRTIPERRRV